MDRNNRKTLGVAVKILAFIILLVAPLPCAAQDGLEEQTPCTVPLTETDTEVQLTVFVDPKGGDACNNGFIAGTYDLAVDHNYKVHFSCVDLIRQPILFNESDPFFRRSPKYIEYMQTVARSFAVPGSTYCGKLGSISRTYYRKGDAAPLERRHMLRLNGRLHSKNPNITIEIRSGRVLILPRQACCTENKQCLGEINMGRDSCPQNSHPAGPNTNCSYCASNFVPPPKPKDDPVSCCVQGSCDSLPESECSLMNGQALPRGTACSVLNDPCVNYTGACIAANGECAEYLTQAECYAFDQKAKHLLGRPCPVQKGGCCDPMGMCRASTAEECPSYRGQFYPGGCPARCAVQQGACTLDCPNETNLKCFNSTFDECQKYGGTGFSTSKLCPEDPVLRMCQEPLCYECRDLAIPEYWPTLDGQLQLIYKNNQCSVLFIDKAKDQHQGVWSCNTEERRRKVNITWSNNTEITLVEAVDGDIVRLIPEFTNNQKPTGVFPCSDAELEKPEDGEIRTGYRKDKIIRKGHYLCAKYKKLFYGVKTKGFITIYHYDGKLRTYYYGYRMRIDSETRAPDGSTVLGGYTIDDDTGKEKTKFSVVYK